MKAISPVITLKYPSLIDISNLNKVEYAINQMATENTLGRPLNRQIMIFKFHSASACSHYKLSLYMIVI